MRKGISIIAVLIISLIIILVAVTTFKFIDYVKSFLQTSVLLGTSRTVSVMNSDFGVIHLYLEKNSGLVMGTDFEEYKIVCDTECNVGFLNLADMDHNIKFRTRNYTIVGSDFVWGERYLEFFGGNTTYAKLDVSDLLYDPYKSGENKLNYEENFTLYFDFVPLDCSKDGYVVSDGGNFELGLKVSSGNISISLIVGDASFNYSETCETNKRYKIFIEGIRPYNGSYIAKFYINEKLVYQKEEPDYILDDYGGWETNTLFIGARSNLGTFEDATSFRIYDLKLYSSSLKDSEIYECYKGSCPRDYRLILDLSFDEKVSNKILDLSFIKGNIDKYLNLTSETYGFLNKSSKWESATVYAYTFLRAGGDIVSTIYNGSGWGLLYNDTLRKLIWRHVITTVIPGGSPETAYNDLTYDLPTSKWVYVTSSYNSSGMYLYLNGKLVNYTSQLLFPVNTSNFTIGNYTGFLDKVYVFNRSLDKDDLIAFKNGYSLAYVLDLVILNRGSKTLTDQDLFLMVYKDKVQICSPVDFYISKFSIVPGETKKVRIYLTPRCVLDILSSKNLKFKICSSTGKCSEIFLQK